MADPEVVIENLTKKPIIARVIDRLRRKLADTLYYHSAEHTLDVLHEAVMFALHDGLSEHELELLAIGAAYHDSGFLRAAKENERHGARTARRVMKKLGYPKEDIEQVERMILDTQVRMGQKGPEQVPTSPLSRYLLDADMSNFGRADFFEKAELVRKEVGADSKLKFYEGVDQFLRSHSWHTASAERLRQKGKLANMEKLRAMLIEFRRDGAPESKRPARKKRAGGATARGEKGAKREGMPRTRAIAKPKRARKAVTKRTRTASKPTASKPSGSRSAASKSTASKSASSKSASSGSAASRSTASRSRKRAPTRRSSARRG